MNVPAVQLPVPTVTDFDLAVTRGGAVADDEVVSKTVRHPSHIMVIVIEDASVALSGSAVMHDDIFPPVACDAGLIDSFTNCRCQILPADAATAGSRDQIFFRFGPGFLDDDGLVIIPAAEEEPAPLLLDVWPRIL